MLTIVGLVFLLNSLPANAIAPNKKITDDHPTRLTISNNTNKKYVIILKYEPKQNQEKTYAKTKSQNQKKEIAGKQEITFEVPNNACIKSVKIDSNSVFSQLLLNKFKKSQLHNGFCNEHQKWTLYFENGNRKKISIKKESINGRQAKIVKY